jgi:hypothetical protein
MESKSAINIGSSSEQEVGTDLYLCNRPVYFKPVEGLYISNDSLEIKRDVPVGPENSQNVLSYKLKDQSHIDPAYALIYLNAIPATDMLVNIERKEEHSDPFT